MEPPMTPRDEAIVRAFKAKLHGETRTEEEEPAVEELATTLIAQANAASLPSGNQTAQANVAAPTNGNQAAQAGNAVPFNAGQAAQTNDGSSSNEDEESNTDDDEEEEITPLQKTRLEEFRSIANPTLQPIDEYPPPDPAEVAAAAAAVQNSEPPKKRRKTANKKMSHEENEARVIEKRTQGKGTMRTTRSRKAVEGEEMEGGPSMEDSEARVAGPSTQSKENVRTTRSKKAAEGKDENVKQTKGKPAS